jgi:hypothetical protein
MEFSPPRLDADETAAGVAGVVKESNQHAVVSNQPLHMIGYISNG